MASQASYIAYFTFTNHVYSSVGFVLQILSIQFFYVFKNEKV